MKRTYSQFLLASGFQLCGQFVVAALVFCYLTAPSQAAIMYGDFDDNPPGVVMYTDVTESSATDDLPLYGEPEADGNVLDFEPLGFGAFATDGAPSADLTDGQLNFDFSTLLGTGMNGLAITEFGDFTLLGSGTSVTEVIAGVFADVEITHINHVELASSISVSGSTTFGADLVSSPGSSQGWGQTLLLDFGPALLNAGFDPEEDFASAGSVVINNTLAAIAETDPSTIAFIAKKGFAIVPSGRLDPDDVVPEPSSVVAGLMAVVLGGFYLRRGK